MRGQPRGTPSEGAGGAARWLAAAAVTVLMLAVVGMWALVWSSPPGWVSLVAAPAVAVLGAAMIRWLVGYRSATPTEAEQVAAGPLWHMTRTGGWGSSGRSPAPGDQVRLLPDRCRSWNRMWVLDRIRFPQPAVYMTVVHPSQAPSWGIPNWGRDVVFMLHPEGEQAREGVFVRSDGAVAFTRPITVTVLAVEDYRARSRAPRRSGTDPPTAP